MRKLESRVDLRQLRYFVTVAEELNFSRAALRLHMSQPPLSHQIKALEDELGVVLLERNRREVKLTPAGRNFLADSRALLDQAQVATQRARQSGLGQAGSLRVGMATSAIDRVLPAFMSGMREHLPLVHVVLTDMSSEEQVRSLAQDRLDLGFVHARVAAKALARQAVHAEVFAVVLPEDYPLARRSSIELRDLAVEPMVSFSPEHRSALFDSLVAVCMNAGFSPRLVHVARHPASMFQMVRQRLGIYALAAQLGLVGRWEKLRSNTPSAMRFFSISMEPPAIIQPRVRRTQYSTSDSWL